jgi:transcriptional regulator with XRE-family HTH domain
MKERILEFLKAENKSSAQFAAEIGVQPSGISHILSGRNNPSLDFVLRMLEKYKYLSSEWLLFGRGKMYRESKMLTLFDELDQSQDQEHRNTVPEKSPGRSGDLIMGKIPELQEVKSTGIRAVKKIVWFYDNNEFEEFIPVN